MTNLCILISIFVYLAFMVGVGVWYTKHNTSADDFYLGGRKLGPYATAMSAEASDMSSWLLMGLPGLAFFHGVADPFWTAAGLAIGTWVNWLLVAKPLRHYSERLGAITVPEFFTKRFDDKRHLLQGLAALVIIIFFVPYTASGFAACGKLFSALFDWNYLPCMIISAVVIVGYTVLGGFLAASVTDLIQSVVMTIALAAVLVFGITTAGGVDSVLANATQVAGYLKLNAMGNILTGESSSYGLLTVISTMAWGLGYFGMPQVLLRFMAIRKEDELKRSRRIAMIWVSISLAVAVFIGIVGRQLFPVEHLTASSAENIFITMSTNFLPPILAGFVMAGILAATISSSDSYLLIASSALAKNIYQGVVKKDASDKQVMWVTRITLLALTLVGIVLALDENSVIFQIVSFAWAGFGATFGPLMLFSLFWKRINKAGAVAGMVSGAAMVFVWKLVIKPLGGIFAIYELLPAFIISSVVIVVVSLMTKEPSKEIYEDFDAVAQGEVEG